jgi:hypothetical protein
LSARTNIINTFNNTFAIKQPFSLCEHEKTRLLEFGRFASVNQAKRGDGKTETFDFPGFTHICARTRKKNRFTVRRKTKFLVMQDVVKNNRFDRCFKENGIRGGHRCRDSVDSWLPPEQ